MQPRHKYCPEQCAHECMKPPGNQARAAQPQHTAVEMLPGNWTQRRWSTQLPSFCLLPTALDQGNVCSERACLRTSSSRNMGRPGPGKLCTGVATQDVADTAGIGRLSAGRPSTSRMPFSFEPRMLENDQCLQMESVWIRLAASKAIYGGAAALLKGEEERTC